MSGSGRHDPSGSTNRYAVQIGNALSITHPRHDRSHCIYDSSPKRVGNFVVFFQLKSYRKGFSEA